MGKDQASCHADGLRLTRDLYDVQDHAPLDGEVLKYSAANAQYEPGIPTDSDAIHDNVAGEIHAITDIAPTALDEMVIEDQSDSWNKKRCQLGDISALGAPAVHASSHTDGTDDIQNATAAQKGLATAAQITKLDGIEALADVTSTHTCDTPGGPGTDTTAIHDDTAGEIHAVTDVAPAVEDEVLIEDATDSWNKKRCQISDIVALAGGGADPDAIHDNAAGEIHAIADAVPANADEVVFEDADDSWNKKRCQISDIWGLAVGIKLDDLTAPDDNTDLNVSITAHGLCPKAPNDANQWLRGDATWATPTSITSAGDITLKLGDAVGVNKLYVKDSADATVFSVDSNGVITGGAAAVSFASSGNMTFKIDNADGSNKWTFTDSGDVEKLGIDTNGDTLWTFEADTFIKIDADTTDHTAGYIMQFDVGVNSATVDVIDIDGAVGTALSAAEVFTAININIDGHGSDDATSIIQGMILTNGGTSTGIKRGLTFSANWDYQVYCDDDLNIQLDTNDASTEFAIYDSDGVKLVSVDSDGVWDGNLAGFEIETASDCAVAALTLDQNDADEPFIEFEGTTDTDASDNISTANGDGDVEGPKNYSSQAGWAFAGMIRIGVNGTDYWTPFYSVDSS